VSTAMSQGRIDINVLVGDIQLSDRELFFGPLEDIDVWIELSVNVRWPDVMVAAGVFTSKSQARKNGWDKDVDAGFTDITVGKLKHRITILKEF
jgi:hypothetical protein